MPLKDRYVSIARVYSVYTCVYTCLVSVHVCNGCVCEHVHVYAMYLG